MRETFPELMTTLGSSRSARNWVRMAAQSILDRNAPIPSLSDSDGAPRRLENNMGVEQLRHN